MAPELSLAAFEAGCAVHSAMSALPPLRRKLILLAFFKGFSHAEIASATQLSLGTVKSHLRRGLLTMRKSIDRHRLSPAA
jgi:RNA polymerase sigma-70 factor (ECF subfamily)